MDYSGFVFLKNEPAASETGILRSSVKSRLLKSFIPLTLILLVTNLVFFFLFFYYFSFHPPLILLLSAILLLVACTVNFLIVYEITKSVGGMLDGAIIERAKAQKKLLAQKLFYENILNKIPVDVAVYDESFKYIYCNPNTIPDEEEREWIIGRSDFDYCKLKNLNENIAIERETLFRKAVSSKFAISLEQNYKNEKGENKFTLRSIIPAENTVGLNTGNHSNTQSFISFGFDITSLKLQEEDLRHKNTELEKTNYELDRFVYSASHDLKAPLSSVLGLINLSKSETKEPNLMLYLDMMASSIVKLDKFIKDLIHFSRNTRKDVFISRVDFEKVISEGVDDLRYMEDADKVRLEKNIDPAVFWSDENRIGTIFNNLISNSVKYHNFSNDDPWIKINVRFHNEKAVIEVKDNGIGIDAGHLDKIFDMFYRATEQSQGSGLGLYIVKEMVRKVNGTIRVESEKGKGTTFIIELPDMLSQQNLNTVGA